MIVYGTLHFIYLSRQKYTSIFWQGTIHQYIQDGYFTLDYVRKVQYIAMFEYSAMQVYGQLGYTTLYIVK